MFDTADTTAEKFTQMFAAILLFAAVVGIILFLAGRFGGRRCLSRSGPGAARGEGECTHQREGQELVFHDVVCLLTTLFAGGR